MTTRRDFLRAAALAAGAAAVPSLARTAAGAGPVERPFGPKMKLSLAAYSFRARPDYPNGLKTSPAEEESGGAAMTLAGFVDYCASLGLDGTELTGYYFPKFVLETPIFRPPADLGGADP
ncbi:MAG TPA: hypothetical protein VF170_06375, partial [Planctomycetaceae bacterium]